MSSPADSSVQNLLPVQAYFDVEGNFVTFIGQNKPFYATPDPDQSGLHITDSTIDSSVIGGITPAAGTFTSLATTTGTIATAAVNPTDIVNKQYVDYFAAGLSWKEPVLTATSANITLSGTQTINGVALVAGDTVLVKDQSTASQNGIYTVAAGAWSRSVGADTWNEYIGAIVFIVEGSLAGTAWYCTAQPGGTLGTTAINWSNFSVASSYTAGTGLTLTGTQFSITNTGVSAGSYGGASKTLSATVNAQGQLTALSESAIAISNTQVSGLGTMSTQNSNNVSITGGSISGVSISGYAQSGANSDITSLSGITGAITSPNYIGFNTSYSTALTAGQLGWDGNNTLGLGMAGGNVTQHIGEDQYFYYKASSAVTKGQVVMFTGAVGASGVPTGAPATGITDGTYIMGVAAEDVALNGFGLVQAFGVLRNVNTTGYADGDILWYNPAVTGGMTITKPSAPNVKVQMAAVINGGSSGGGTILIRINPGSILGGTDSNVQFGTLASNNLIQYNGTYWTNIAPSSLTGVGSVANAVTFNNGGAGDASGTTFNGSAARTISYNSVGAPSTSGTGASGTWSINVTGSAGSATTATTATNLAGGATGSLPYQASSGSTTFLAAGSDGQVLKLASGVPTWSSDSSGVTVVDDTTTNATYYPLLANATTGNITTEYVSSTKLVFNPSTGNLGIGTSSPSTKLTVSSTYTSSRGQLSVVSTDTDVGQTFYVGSTFHGVLSFSSSYGYIGTASNTPLVFGANNAGRMWIDTSGNVGIGTSSPGSKLHVSGGVVRSSNSGNTVYTELQNDGIYSTGTSLYLVAPSSQSVLAYTNNSLRLTIDSTGNALFAQAVRATITTDNDLSFDMNAASNFKCTPTAGGALTFTNITSGQTGNIILINGSNYAITAAATTKVSATCLATISATGTYWLSYYSDGTNVYVANTGALS